MATPAYSILYSAKVDGAETPGGPGDALIKSASTGLYVKSTTANRGTRRSTGMALTNYVAGGTVEILQFGEIDATTAGLGIGTASWVRASATGTLERAAVAGADDVVGWVEADGTFKAVFGFLTAAMTSGGGGSFTPPTGTGFVTVTAGVMDGAALAQPLSVAKGGTGIAALAAGMATWWASGTSSDLRAALTDETGTGSAVFGTTPTIATPILTTPRVQTRLDIDNPAGTFQYQITPAALAANRILNLPLLLATDTVAVLAFAQTLTNKTMVAASNTITDTSAVAHDLFVHDGTRFARRAKGSDGTVLQYAAGALVASGIDFGSVTLSGQVPEARLSTTLGGLTSDVATTGRVTGIIRHGGAVVTQAGGSSNNQAVTNGKVRVTSSCAFTGFDATGMQDGDVIFVIVVGGVNPTIDNQSASSLAANRVITSSGATSTLIGDAVYMLYYDGTSSRWRTFQAAPMIP